LARRNVALVSITENLDYSTPQGKLFMTMLSGLGKF
jgi:DNA invertase Pin-like site-specific DNA recombinase